MNHQNSQGNQQRSGRRSHLKWLVTSLLLLPFCKKEKKDSSGSGNSIDPSELPVGKSVTYRRDNRTPPEVDPADLPEDVKPSTVPDPEFCPDFFKLDLTRINPVKERLISQSKAYGPQGFTLLALKLPQYVHGSLRSLFLTYIDGRLIAQKTISSSSDIDRYGKLKIQTFDNLSLEEGQELVWVFKAGSEFFKSPPFTVSFETSFRGKSVRSPFLDPQANIVVPYTFRDFVPDIPKGVLKHSDKKFWFSGNESSFHSNPDFSGWIITDVFGDIIEEHGERYTSAAASHTQIIAYKPIGDQYERHFIRLP